MMLFFKNLIYLFLFLSVPVDHCSNFYWAEFSVST